MIKYLVTTAGLLITSVGFLYYLINNSNFIPIDPSGNYVVGNIIVLLFIAFLVLSCVSCLAIYCFRKLVFKQLPDIIQVKLSIKYALIFCIGTLIVYLLHFFHILNFFWGFSVLIVVILSLFVI